MGSETIRDPSRVFTDFAVTSASYIIFKKGNVIYAKNGETGAIEFSGTDASTVIQNAIDNLTSGRTWKEKVVLRGSFTLSDTITIPSYTILDMSGSYLKLDDNVNKNMITTENYANYVDIIGGILDGNKNNNSDQGVDGEQCGIFNDMVITHYSIKNVKVINTTREGFYLHGSWCHLEDLYASGTGKTGIELDAISYCTAVNLRALNCELHGFDLVGGDTLTQKPVTIIGGDIYGASGYGLRVYRSRGAKIVGLKVRHCGFGGTYKQNIFVDGCEAVSLQGIECSEAYEIGCYLYNSNRVNIIGGAYYNNGQRKAGAEYGIRLYNCTECIISGGEIFDNQSTKTQRYGIYEDGGSDYNIITNNLLKGNSVAGLYTTGANTVTDNNIV